MKEPLVSVVMPSFNDRCEFLKESIESILNQTYKNLELIIADDSTLEESKYIIDSYANKDSRIIINRREGRRGISAAVNDAIKMAKGDYIAHMDADDVSLPNRLELQMKLFKSKEVSVVGGHTVSIDEYGNEKPQALKLPCNDTLIKKGFKDGLACVLNPTSLVRKEVFNKVGGYEELWKCAEDYDMWYRIAALRYEFANVPEVVLKYRSSHGENDHIKRADILPKFCCMSRLKYSLGISRRLSEKEFLNIEELVESHPLCRLSIVATKKGSVLYNLIKKMNLRKIVIRITNAYFARHRNYYLTMIER